MNCSVCNSTNRPGAHFCSQCRAPLVLQGKYRTTRLLGRGGYGAVYQAEHTQLGGVMFAVKELLPDPSATPEQLQAASVQFRLEASILANLSHSALPKVIDFFTEGNRDYLVMDYIAGETLEEYLKRTRAPLPEAQVLAWAQELCDALAYLHSRQPNPVIHRDIKPSNIKIAPDGKIKLLDFGIAKLLAAGAGTQSAARAVTPPYSPMEQYGKGTDARSDIYALGVTLYQLLTNHLPPEAPDRVGEAVIPPRQLNPSISSGTETVILKAMAEKMSDRYQYAAEMKNALVSASSPAHQPTVPAFQPIYQPMPQPQPVASAPYASARPAFNWQSITPLQAGLLIVAALLIVCAVFGISLVVNFQSQANATATAVAIAQRTSQAATATAQAQATATAQTQATMIAQANATATAQAQATLTAQAWATMTAQAIAFAQAQANATATARAQATAQAQANATATALARRPLTQFTFGRKGWYSSPCSVVEPTTTLKRTEFDNDKWVYFAAPYDATVLNTKLYWTVYYPDGSEAYSRIERTLDNSTNEWCFKQGFALASDDPLGNYVLAVEHNGRVIYRIVFTIVN